MQLSAISYPRRKYERFLGVPKCIIELIPFEGELITLGNPTFEGEEGKIFCKILQSH